jgi:hypothetical protein
MEEPIDLDAAATLIDRRRPQWTEAGFVVGPLTWRDVARPWPHPLVPRGEARAPDSVGVSAVRGTTEFSVVLFGGPSHAGHRSWADVVGADLATGEVETLAPELRSVDEFDALLAATFDRWSRSRHIPQR